MTDNKSIVFAAVNHERVPCYGPEEINICAVVDRQSQADIKIERLSQQVEHITQSGAGNAIATSASIKLTEELNAKLLALKDNIDTQLSHLDRPLLVPATSAAPTISDQIKDEQAVPSDWSRNVVVTGITEDNNFRQWHSKLTNVLQLAAGREVIIIDVFRLGRFKPDRARPILVKLNSVWDKRLILSNAHTLAHHPVYRRSVYIRADESLEFRRKNTLAWLRNRARRQGHMVDLSTEGDELSIDGVHVFTLARGFVANVEVRNGQTAPWNGE
jgi:hypothetical protein